MTQELKISPANNEEKYSLLLKQIDALTFGEVNLIANLANVAAALRQTFSFFWVGFYIVEGNELVLGPFQGDIACTRIQKGRGVCGTSWQQSKSIIVPNVDEFPGHIACSSLSKSEIVIPILKNNKVVAILDIDSDILNDFDETDQKYLEKLCVQLSALF
jgi:GAF domain-containing protein